MQACLKKEGVELPQFRRGNGRPPSGQRPPGGGGFRSSPEAEKIRKALQKCGVTLPSDTTNS